MQMIFKGVPLFYQNEDLILNSGKSGLHAAHLILIYLHILEQKHVITESQGLVAGSSHISENDFPGSDIGKLLLI